VLVEHKDITVEAGSMLGNNHNPKLPNLNFATIYNLCI
jgi:hypothetical protein